MSRLDDQRATRNRRPRSIGGSYGGDRAHLFVDADVRGETLISVRAGAGLVKLRLVLAEGEVDLVMTPADCQRLREALHLAAVHAQQRSS